MISRRRLSCAHESGHIVGARSQKIPVLRAVVPFSGDLEASDGYGRAAGKTHFGITRALLPRFGPRAAIALLAGGLMEKLVGGQDWIAGSASDFEQVIESLRFTRIDYGELVHQTEEIVREWWGVADRIADYLKVHGSLDARKINEIYAYR
jgi:hypothetical protein